VTKKIKIFRKSLCRLQLHLRPVLRYSTFKRKRINTSLMPLEFIRLYSICPNRFRFQSHNRFRFAGTNVVNGLVWRGCLINLINDITFPAKCVSKNDYVIHLFTCLIMFIIHDKMIQYLRQYYYQLLIENIRVFITVNRLKTGSQSLIQTSINLTNGTRKPKNPKPVSV